MIYSDEYNYASCNYETNFVLDLLKVFEQIWKKINMPRGYKNINR